MKIIYNNVYALLYLSKTTRQHHRDNTEGSEKNNDYPKAKNIKTHNIKLKTTAYTTRFGLTLDVGSGLG